MPNNKLKLKLRILEHNGLPRKELQTVPAVRVLAEDLVELGTFLRAPGRWEFARDEADFSEDTTYYLITRVGENQEAYFFAVRLDTPSRKDRFVDGATDAEAIP